MSDSATPWTAVCQASQSITNSWSLLKLMSIELVMPSNHLICHPLLPFSSCLFPSIRIFSNESVLRIRWPKYWSFSFSIGPSNEYSGLISFRTDQFDLPVQGTLKSLESDLTNPLTKIHRKKPCFLLPSCNLYSSDWNVFLALGLPWDLLGSLNTSVSWVSGSGSLLLITWRAWSESTRHYFWPE